MKRLGIVPTLLLCASVSGDPSTRPSRQVELVRPDGVHLSATLELDKRYVRTSELVTVRVSIKNHGVAVWLYNPFLNGRISLPLMLLGSRPDGVERGGGSLMTGGMSSPGARHSDWVYVPPSSQVGSTHEISMALVPGTYDLQLVFFKSFLDSRLPENATAEDFSRFEEYLDRSELFRSNAVRIRIDR